MKNLVGCALQISFAYFLDFALVCKFLKEHNDNVIVHNENIFVFLRLDLPALIGIRSGVVDIKDPEVLARLFDLKGEHIHFISVSGGGVKNILSIRNLLKSRSFSWFIPDMNKFVYFERSF